MVETVDNHNYYHALEVEKTASPKDIACAFRRLSLKWHPKLAKADPNTSYRNLCKISEAYEVLSNNERRETYDKFGENKLKEGIFENGTLRGGYKFAGNPEEIFEQFFGTRNPYEPLFDKESNKEARSIFSSLYPEANIDALQDLVVKVDCSLSEVYNGCRKKISYHKHVLNKDGRTTTEVPESKQIEIKAGVSASHKIVFKGLGHEQAGISNSDLVFEVKEVKDPKWKRIGNDLIYHADITWLDALEAKPFSIKTLGGRILNLAFDEPISPQTVRSIEEEGMPIHQDGLQPSESYKAKVERGNLLVKFNILFPTSLTVEQSRELGEILTS